MPMTEQAKHTLIRGARIYDHNGDVHQPPVADLLIANGLIARIAPGIPADGADVIEAAGKLVIPGFVNAHYHSHDVMMKGLFEEMPFDVWTVHMNAASYGRRSHKEVRLRTLVGAAEMLRNGITTVQDFLTVYPGEPEYVDTVLKAYAEAGIRVVFAIAARDQAALDIAPLMAKGLPEAMLKRLTGTSRPAKDELDFVAGSIKRLGLEPGPLQSWALAPSAPQRCSHELLEGIAALSRQHNLPVFTHVYETRIQAAAARVQSNSLLDVLAKAGLVNERLNLVHGVWLSLADIAMLAEAKSRVVHNPMSNLKLKSGVAPILDLNRAGIEIALGCDNCSCAESQNIFVAMRMLCLLPSVTSPEPHPIDAAYAMRAATTVGASAVGLGGKVGALKAGMAADLAILRLDEPAFIPFNSAARQIAYAEAGRAVETVIVGGRTVVRDGRLVTVDETELAAAVGAMAAGFRSEVKALAERSADLIPPLLEGNRAAWKVPLGFERYVGRGGKE